MRCSIRFAITNSSTGFLTTITFEKSGVVPFSNAWGNVFRRTLALPLRSLLSTICRRGRIFLRRRGLKTNAKRRKSFQSDACEALPRNASKVFGEARTEKRFTYESRRKDQMEKSPEAPKKARVSFLVREGGKRPQGGRNSEKRERIGTRKQSSLRRRTPFTEFVEQFSSNSSSSFPEQRFAGLRKMRKSAIFLNADKNRTRTNVRNERFAEEKKPNRRSRKSRRTHAAVPTKNRHAVLMKRNFRRERRESVERRRKKRGEDADRRKT